MLNSPQKIFIAGNIGSGKTYLARRLAATLKLPLYHVDTLQFNQDLSIKPYRETLQELQRIQQSPRWIIDGYGPLDLIHKRLEDADLVIYLDPPFWQNQLRLLFRQISVGLRPRSELPAGAREFKWNHMRRALQNLRSSHRQMRPEMLRLLSSEKHKSKSLIFNCYLNREQIRELSQRITSLQENT